MAAAVSNEEEELDPLVGKVLDGRYRVVRKLGQGGMGAVYEAEQVAIKKRVALKVLHPQYVTTAAIASRFRQEALSATAIGHENIVEVHDLSRTSDGVLYMVLELLTGSDFAGVLAKEQRVSIARAVHIVQQIATAVQAAHDKGIVHRDLKPENVFLIRRGADPEFVKVLDFGISKMLAGDGSEQAVTKTGAIIGTAYYMSPEQAQGHRDLDHRSDVWALGVILFRALTGRYPFDDDAYPMLVLRIITETPPSMRSLRPDIPDELDQVVARCLTRDVTKRVQSARELAELLEPFATMDAPPPPLDAREQLAATMPAGSTPRVATPEGSKTGPIRDVPAVSGVKTKSLAGERASAPAASSSMRVVALVAGTAAIAIFGTWLATRPAPQEEVVAEAVAPPAVPAPVDVEEPPPPPTPRAYVEFLVSPSDALVLIDGRPVAPGPGGALVREVSADDLAVHELRVEARGFRTRVEDLRVSLPQRIVLSLDPGVGIDDHRSEHAAPPRPPPHVRADRDHETDTRPAAPPLLTTEDP